MQEIMRSMGQMDMPDIKPILEINPDHEIVKVSYNEKGKSFENAALLFEQAIIQEGGKLKDPSGFVKWLNEVLAKAI